MTKLPLSDWPVRASLAEDDLILTSRLGLDNNTGPLAGYPGKEITTAAVDQDAETFSWTDPQGNVTSHGPVRMDLSNYVTTQEVSSYGLFLGGVTSEISEESIGYRLQVHTDPSDGLGYILHPSSPWTITGSSPSYNEVWDSLGNKLTVSSIYVNGSYYRAINLIGNNSGGALWANGTSNRYATYTLTEDTMIEKVLVENYRSDHRINQVRLDYHDGSKWVSLGTFPVSAAVNAGDWIELPEPVMTKGFRLYASDVTGYGGLGRFLLKFRRNAIMSNTTYEEFAFDTTVFDVVETEDAVTVSLKSDNTAFEIGSYGRSEERRVLITSTAPIYSPGGNKYFTIPFYFPVTNGGTAKATMDGVEVDGTTVALTAGQYTATFSFHASRLGEYRFNVVDSETGMVLGYTDALYNGIFQDHVGLQYLELDFFIPYDRKVSLELATAEKGIVVPEGKSFTAAFYKTSSNPRSQVEILPTGVSRVPCRVLSDLTMESLLKWNVSFQGDLANEVVYLAVDSDFKLFRTGNPSYPTALGELKMYDAFTGEDISSKLTLPTVNDTTISELISAPIKAGIYRIEGTGAPRRENGWLPVALEDGDVIE